MARPMYELLGLLRYIMKENPYCSITIYHDPNEMQAAVPGLYEDKQRGSEAFPFHGDPFFARAWFQNLVAILRSRTLGLKP